MHNPLHELLSHGQSIWLDELRRDWLENGELERRIEQDLIRGVTSNPSIFEVALSESAAYDSQLRELAASGLSTSEIYDRLTLDDIRGACDAFASMYERTGGADGFVSHEVQPSLAYDTTATVNEVRRIWRAVERPNLMVKIPATREGIPAVRQCLSEGINVNITLMFTLSQYREVAEAYLAALEARAEAGEVIHGIASVASFFVSRVDSKVDSRLQGAPASADGDGAGRSRADSLIGKAAVANAARAYSIFWELFGSARYAALELRGAAKQRVLWASTSTKNPSFSDVKYVEELVAPHTVTTLPSDTLERFRDHGAVGALLGRATDDADTVVDELGSRGIDLEAVGDELTREGVGKFADSFEGALRAVERGKSRVSVS